MGFGLLLPMGQFSSWLSLFVGGAIAVCVILPALSGSFVLLLLGLYDDVIVAISDLDFMSLSAVALGCATGLALFVRALSWLYSTMRIVCCPCLRALWRLHWPSCGLSRIQTLRVLLKAYFGLGITQR